MEGHQLTRRGSETVRKGRQAGVTRTTFGALFFALAIFARLVIPAAHASLADAGWFCAPTGEETSVSAAHAPHHDHAGLGFDHCSDCAMGAAPTLSDKPPLTRFAPPDIRIVAFYESWIDPLERRRPGLKRSRAPPAFS